MRSIRTRRAVEPHIATALDERDVRGLRHTGRAEYALDYSVEIEGGRFIASAVEDGVICCIGRNPQP
jgi:hypothetical protein